MKDIRYVLQLITRLNYGNDVDMGVLPRCFATPDRAVAYAREDATKNREWLRTEEHSSQSHYAATFEPEGGGASYQMVYKIFPVMEEE